MLIAARPIMAHLRAVWQSLTMKMVMTLILLLKMMAVIVAAMKGMMMVSVTII